MNEIYQNWQDRYKIPGYRDRSQLELAWNRAEDLKQKERDAVLVKILHKSERLDDRGLAEVMQYINGIPEKREKPTRTKGLINKKKTLSQRRRRRRSTRKNRSRVGIRKSARK